MFIFVFWGFFFNLRNEVVDVKLEFGNDSKTTSIFPISRVQILPTIFINYVTNLENFFENFLENMLIYRRHLQSFLNFLPSCHKPFLTSCYYLLTSCYVLSTVMTSKNNCSLAKHSTEEEARNFDKDLRKTFKELCKCS